VTARELITWEYTCHRCGYTERVEGSSRLDERWERRRGIDLCPGCVVDLYRFLTNRAVMKQLSGDEYRFPDPEERAALMAELAEKGVGW
jgi:hypothetical protein